MSVNVFNKTDQRLINVSGGGSGSSLEIIDKTQAQYDVLTDAEKNDASKLYNITDADDLDLTSYAKQSDVDAINSN